MGGGRACVVECGFQRGVREVTGNLKERGFRIDCLVQRQPGGQRRLSTTRLVRRTAASHAVLLSFLAYRLKTKNRRLQRQIAVQQTATERRVFALLNSKRISRIDRRNCART